MKSPFKFLDAFDMEDKDVFFGRDLEIKDLYKKVSMSPLLLVYGLSGTGKTSLVSCGLAKNFNGPDWYPFFIRRKKDVNSSLIEELTQATGDRGEESICEKLSFLYDRYLCPLYLIFDQFEELFILGSQEEQDAFAENLLEIMEADIPVKIILIMREEYLGDLYQLEQKISTIYDNRLRVETMRREKVKDVLKLSFSKFQIGLEGEDEDRLNQIIDNLSDEKSGIVQLPYLQVYLDMIYKEEFAKEHPGEVFDEENLKPIQITQQEITDFGRIDDVLDRFLRTQLADIPERLKEGYPDVNTKLIENILDGFVTEDGTKRPVQVTEEDGGDDAPNLIHLPEGETPFFQGVAPPAIPIKTFSVILHELVKSRLLRYNEEGMELAHDTLAALVDRRRGHEQRIKKDFQKLYNALQNTNSKLDKQQILTYQQYFPILKLDPTLESFIDESVSEVKRKEEAEEFARQE
ncbi:MAG: ATP-binding protein, partial [Bacteroidota bacterium]